jgi:hypothetical protein
MRNGEFRRSDVQTFADRQSDAFDRLSVEISSRGINWSTPFDYNRNWHSIVSPGQSRSHFVEIFRSTAAVVIMC